MVQSIDYFYNEQIRRSILHFGRLMMGWQISIGKDDNGEDILRKVPCRYASTDRQAMQILNGNSENIMQVAPIMTYVLYDVDIARDRVQVQHDINNEQIYTREYDEVSGEYTSNLDNTYRVDRMNPVALTYIFKVYIWTTKLAHKLQLFEQIKLMFNPSVDLQTSTEVMDWLRLSVVELTNISWSSKLPPVGSTDTLDIMELDFRAESWISPPAKVTKLQNINTMVTNIGTDSSCISDIFDWDMNSINRSVFTPENYYINVLGSEITLLDAFGTDTKTDWFNVMEKYGVYQESITGLKIRALTTNIEDASKDIIGTVVIDENDPTKLTWSVDPDTYPTATLDPVDEIINPIEKFPGKGLPAESTGQRYLITEDIPQSTSAWGITNGANKWDIIQYDGTKWVIEFEAIPSIATGSEIVVSSTTSFVYIWDNENGWVSPTDGVWKSGWWKLTFLEN